jgi:RNA ligase (TIGR02306 family)
MRKLATIQTIKEILQIEGADAIEIAVVNGWSVVVAKNAHHKVGDKVVYCEIDSFLPIEPEFEFLRKSSYKKLSDGTEGFRLRTIKLRGQISQGLIISLLDAKKITQRNLNIDDQDWLEGEDVSGKLGIIKYEPPVPASLQGIAKGLFPSFIPKTDEERIQNLSETYFTFKENPVPYYVTEKLDGSSATYYYRNGEFGVCSRNLELIETDDNTFWKVARILDLENKLKSLHFNVSLQGELVGEGIQGNPYKILGQKVFFFNAYNIDEGRYLDFDRFMEIIDSLELSTVPVLETNFKLPDTIEEILSYSENKSSLNKSFDREGVVIRSVDRKISFKAISNRFLLNEK